MQGGAKVAHLKHAALHKLMQASERHGFDSNVVCARASHTIIQLAKMMLHPGLCRDSVNMKTSVV